MVIKRFKCKETEKIFKREFSKRIPKDIYRQALKKLLMIDAATLLDTLRISPANRLEKLKGDRVGQYSIRINDQWRICFRWIDRCAFDVEIVDYH